jgi:hypothetical protein
MRRGRSLVVAAVQQGADRPTLGLVRTLLASSCGDLSKAVMTGWVRTGILTSPFCCSPRRRGGRSSRRFATHGKSVQLGPASIGQSS